MWISGPGLLANGLRSGPSQNKITVRLNSTLYGRTYVEHSGYREAGADYGMNPGFRTPPDPEAYYNGLLGVKIIPYSLK